MLSMCGRTTERGRARTGRVTARAPRGASQWTRIVTAWRSSINMVAGAGTSRAGSQSRVCGRDDAPSAGRHSPRGVAHARARASGGALDVDEVCRILVQDCGRAEV